MRHRQAELVTAIVLAVAASVISAQAPPRPANTFRGTANTPLPPLTPEVHPDRTVTFRLEAPAATRVEVELETGRLALSRDAAGAWSATAGPLAPDVYAYRFLVDGRSMLDPFNPDMEIGRFIHASLLDVPASPPRIDQLQDVAHGVVHRRTYRIRSGLMRRLYVYVPDGYDDAPGRRYPVLYLLHGNGGMENSWVDVGRAGVMLDNLIAQRRATPMIVVMPNGYPASGVPGSSVAGIDEFGREIVEELVPYVDRNYRTAVGRETRAIAGLSMGGGQAFFTGLRNLDRFAWIGEFASGVISDADFDLQKALPVFGASPDGVHRQLRLLFLSCGTDDPRFTGQLEIRDELQQRGIRHVWVETLGGHDFRAFRRALAAFLEAVFK